MTPAFIAAVTAMLVVALLLVLAPLCRENADTRRRLRESRAELRALDEAYSAGSLGETDYASRRAALGEALLSILDAGATRIRTTVYVGVAAAVVVPLAALGMYRWLGSPQTLGAPASESGDTAMPLPDHGTDMQAAVAKLAEQLRQHPDDAEGWALLARTYKATEHFAEARDAFRHALEAAPGDPDLAREYAAVERPADAGQDLERALPAAPATESGGAAEVNSIGPSDPAAGSGAEESGSNPESASAPESSAAHIVVKVALDPKYKDSVAPNDTLFVFAKAQHGPPMPLAIARLTAAQLPATVTLTDAMGMVPSLTLSKFPQVVVGARISKSGNASAQSGDLQTLSASTTTAQAEPVHLIIAERID
jgi:cytochrome c-type biogenesis protein CcmH